MGCTDYMSCVSCRLSLRDGLRCNSEKPRGERESDGNRESGQNFSLNKKHTQRFFKRKKRSRKKNSSRLFPPCFLLLRLFLIGEDSSLQPPEVFFFFFPPVVNEEAPAGSRRGGSAVAEAQSLSTQAHILPLPVTTAVAEAGSQRA